jgi:hypothetical protein
MDLSLKNMLGLLSLTATANWPVYKVSARTSKKTAFLFYSIIVAVEICLFA